MNIGTAKPTKQEMSGVVHHMLDIVDPYEEFTLSDFLKLARPIISDAQSACRHIVVVGGTGLYIDALYLQYSLPSTTGSNPAKIKEDMSIDELQAEIYRLSYPMPANSLNKRHLINTLKRAGQSGLSEGKLPNSLLVGIKPDQDVLLDRINRRVELMFDGGLVDEVHSIIKEYGSPKQFDAIGYRIVASYINDLITLDEAKEKFKVADRQYAKRQLTWFKRNKDIVWFDKPDDAKSYILNLC